MALLSNPWRSTIGADLETDEGFCFGFNISPKVSIKEAFDFAARSLDDVDGNSDASNFANDVGTFFSETKEGTGTLPTTSVERSF